jgi:hypothetical protein
MALYLGDVKSTTLAASGLVFGGPARVKGIYYTANASAGSIVIKNGGSSGTTVINIATPSSGYGYIPIPADGVVCSTNAYATMTNLASVTVFYG